MTHHHAADHRFHDPDAHWSPNCAHDRAMHGNPNPQTVKRMRMHAREKRGDSAERGQK